MNFIDGSTRFAREMSQNTYYKMKARDTYTIMGPYIGNTPAQESGKYTPQATTPA
jgi:hypothetical protein